MSLLLLLQSPVGGQIHYAAASLSGVSACSSVAIRVQTAAVSAAAVASCSARPLRIQLAAASAAMVTACGALARRLCFALSSLPAVSMASAVAVRFCFAASTLASAMACAGAARRLCFAASLLATVAAASAIGRSKLAGRTTLPAIASLSAMPLGGAVYFATAVLSALCIHTATGIRIQSAVGVLACSAATLSFSRITFLVSSTLPCLSSLSPTGHNLLKGITAQSVTSSFAAFGAIIRSVSVACIAAAALSAIPRRLTFAETLLASASTVGVVGGVVYASAGSLSLIMGLTSTTIPTLGAFVHLDMLAIAVASLIVTHFYSPTDAILVYTRTQAALVGGDWLDLGGSGRRTVTLPYRSTVTVPYRSTVTLP